MNFHSFPLPDDEEVYEAGPYYSYTKRECMLLWAKHHCNNGKAWKSERGMWDTVNIEDANDATKFALRFSVQPYTGDVKVWYPGDNL